MIYVYHYWNYFDTGLEENMVINHAQRENHENKIESNQEEECFNGLMTSVSNAYNDYKFMYFLTLHCIIV